MSILFPDKPPEQWTTRSPGMSMPQQGPGAVTCGLFVLQYIICAVNNVDCGSFTRDDIFPSVYSAIAKSISTRILDVFLPKVRASAYL
jgi:hypothetical protein